MFTYYNPTIVETNILCLPYLYIVINTIRLINYLINYPTLVIITVATTIVAATTITTIAAITTALTYDTIG
jgi:hypothetical protein